MKEVSGDGSLQSAIKLLMDDAVAEIVTQWVRLRWNEEHTFIVLDYRFGGMDALIPTTGWVRYTPKEGP